MGIIKSKSQIKNIKYAAKIVGEVLERLKDIVKEGVTSLEIDSFVEKYIRRKGGRPAFKGWYGYPNASCISINSAVIHGIPDDTVIKSGDLVSVDIGVEWKEGFGDSAYTYLVGDVSDEVKQLARITEESLYKAIEQSVVNNRIGDIGNTVQEYVKPYNYGIVKEYCGHGIGETLWEEPQIPNYGRKGRGKRLKANQSICIEPMINLGTGEIYVKDDGWTVVTKDGKPSAHYEHQLLITDNGPEILSKP
ncbi:MAG: type I methionyl aminopeptidase [Spirochaetota bacterium]